MPLSPFFAHCLSRFAAPQLITERLEGANTVIAVFNFFFLYVCVEAAGVTVFSVLGRDLYFLHPPLAYVRGYASLACESIRFCSTVVSRAEKKARETRAEKTDALAG